MVNDDPTKRERFKLDERSVSIGEMEARSTALSSKVGAVRQGVSTASALKPLVVGALLLFFILGPGIAAFMQILGSMNLWMWLGLGVMGILIWRNY